MPPRAGPDDGVSDEIAGDPAYAYGGATLTKSCALSATESGVAAVAWASARAPARSRTPRTACVEAPAPERAPNPNRHDGCGAQSVTTIPRSRAVPLNISVRPGGAAPCAARPWASVIGTKPSLRAAATSSVRTSSQSVAAR